MMAGTPTNWWSMIMNGNMHPQSHYQNFSSSSSSSNSSSSHFYGADNPNQEFPRSLSQLLLSGFSGDQEKFGISPFHEAGNSEDQTLNSVHPSATNFRVPVADVKPELGQLYDYHHHVQNEFHAASLQEKLELPTDFTRPLTSNWSPQDLPSPASSCITTGLSHNLLNFTSHKNSKGQHKHQRPDHNSSECNSTTSGGISKKARVQHSTAQPSLKVRKEKLGDRITSLHQLVSPFGKTDTASVLSEAIGYIRFLQGQIQALSTPYLGNASGSMGHIPQQSFLDGNCLKRRPAYKQDSQHKVKDLKSRGLCLVPISCMANVGSDTGADYWAPALGGGF
ncbi:transcription factor bHLH68-like isoform X1 [Lycium ferocissimum]|uniref:transcription factor bHLH68-like isoform X1 n=1 Tax=Lycium ferocissimum TaxID=112874 RepID=UPI00281527BD|nr:transcription factor bHLH68-like isoform X1 [Lycium ferocissimum]